MFIEIIKSIITVASASFIELMCLGQLPTETDLCHDLGSVTSEQLVNKLIGEIF